MTPYPRTRFAPSPTGRLHLGHAYAAWFAWDRGGRSMVLRIEDIDLERSKLEYEEGIIEDLTWLGLWPSGSQYRQTENQPLHQSAFDSLRDRALVYPCFCTRQEILAEAARSASAPHGPDGPIYPGTCRRLSITERMKRLNSGMDCVWRLDVALASVECPDLTWHDQQEGTQIAKPQQLGDFVLVRKGHQFSYHLCCVVDDADQGITLVTRGNDLFQSTHVHRLLQALLDLPTPDYCHHDLVGDENGIRLAKRADSLSIQTLRDQGLSAEEVLALAHSRFQINQPAR